MATSVTTSVGSSISFGYSGLNPLILEPMLLSVGRWHFSAFQSLLCVLSGSQVKVFCNFPIRCSPQVGSLMGSWAQEVAWLSPGDRVYFSSAFSQQAIDCWLECSVFAC
jgi:hypothetical protein